MCGLAGIVRFDSVAPELGVAVERMLDTMVRRGPDGVGVHRDDAVVLAHRRLILLDADGGTQPFYNEDRGVVVVFNGEIYNHRELRGLLSRRGHHFAGYSDGEVITHLYEEHGMDFLRHLDGMFAIALYDRTLARVLLARDRTGEKPLFYVDVGGALVFASTIRALCEVPGVRRRLDPVGLLGYFAHTQPAAPSTMFAEIRKLPPAHALEVRRDHRAVLRPYWTIDFTRKLTCTFDDAVDQLDSVLRDAVAATMDSDYRPALTLSGGVDSSLMLAFMARQRDDVACFSLGSTEPGDKEFTRAAKAADVCGVSTHRFPVRHTGYDAMVESMQSFDEPVSVYDSIYLLQHSERISRTHRVALTGNGADEELGGYDGYIDYLGRCGECRGGKLELDKAMEDFLRQAIDDDAALLYSPKGAAFAGEYPVSAHLSQLLSLANYDDRLDSRMCYDLFFGMSHCASLADTVGMAYSLEYRSPFLSRPVVEFAASVPSRWKVDMERGATKPLLKAVALRYFPRELVMAPKLGCGHFVGSFERMRVQWREAVEAAILRHTELLSDFISTERALGLWRTFVSGNIQGIHRRRPLKLAMLVAWLDAHADSIE